jgi:paraquat-inducible protein A
MANLFKLIVCPVCGQEHRGAEIEEGATVRCARCDSVIFQDTRKSVSRVLAFSAGALMLYVPANIYPILSIKRLGVYSESTIWQGVRELFANGYWGVAILVFLASIVIPLLKLVVMIYLAGASRRGGHELLKFRLFRLIEIIGPWSMLDVFLAAILVALVKLGDVATIKPEPGLIAFAAVVVLTLLASASFEPRNLWNEDRRHEQRT